MSEKSILEQALLQVQTLEEAVKQNAKGILSSTMKKELNELLRETTEEEEEKNPTKEEEGVTHEEETSEQETDDETGEETGSEEGDEEGDETNDEFGRTANDETGDEEGDETGDEFGGGAEDETGDEEGDETGDEFGGGANDETGDAFGDESNDEEDVYDMTKSTDDEVLKVFKALKPEDGVVVKKDGDHLDLDMGEDEYIIKLDDESDGEMDESALSTEESHDIPEEEMSEDETIYEIELDEEDEIGEEEKKIEATEAARTKSNPHGNKGGMNRAGLPSKKKYKAGSGVNINEEYEKLKQQNGEYKKALVLFKDKLNEVAVFNANLAYATRLFTEHTTTKKEKLDILKRFDSISNMNESKNLYKTIKTELETKKPISESVVEKISNTPTTSASNELLSESKAYENPQFKRMKDLMSKMK